MKPIALLVLLIFIAFLLYHCITARIERAMVIAVIVANVLAISTQINNASPGRDQPNILERMYQWVFGEELEQPCPANSERDLTKSSAAHPAERVGVSSGARVGVSNEERVGVSSGARVGASNGEREGIPNEEGAAQAPETGDDPVLDAVYGPRELIGPKVSQEMPPLRGHQQYSGGFAATGAKVGRAIEMNKVAQSGQITTDDLMTAHALARNRSRDAQVGAAAKTVDWYRYHIGDVFDRTEDVTWWGRNEQAPIDQEAF
jgi:hypothetical protein